MSQFSPVAWKDGMFLLPQHFQQSERSRDFLSNFRFQAGGPLCWGILNLELNEAAIAQGRLEIIRCQAIMPDGLPISIPDADSAPPARAFQLPTQAAGLEAFLAIPARRARNANVAADPARADVRYLEHVLDVPDDQDPARSQAVEIAAKNIRIVMSNENREGLVCLKIADIMRSNQGVPALRPDALFPLVRTGASPYLERMARDLLALIAARARNLSEERRLRGNAMEFNASDILSFWYLHTLNLHVGVLRQLLELPSTHPLELYLEFARLASGLATFGSNDVELPPYQHEQPGPAFIALDRRLRDLLGTLFTSRYEIIALVRKDPFWVGHIADPELRRTGEFIMAVSGDVTHADLAAKFPNACKISELDGIERLVRTYVGGVRISHLPRPPSTLPIRGDACYFRVHTDSADWDNIRVTGQLAAYVPSWLPNLRIELVGVRAGGN